MARVRTIGPFPDPGHMWNVLLSPWADSNPSNTSFGKQQVIDVVAPGDGFDLTVNKFEWHEHCRLNGYNSFNTRLFENWTPVYMRGDGWVDHLPISGRPTDAALATALLAQTNPSRPVVDIPVFIGELWDLPDLVRKAGGGLLREIASGNLKYQFGIRPLVSDLMSMLNFSSITARRFKELKKLQKSGLRRKRQLWSGSNSSSELKRTTPTSDVAIRHQLSATTTSRVWGFVEWFPSGNFPETDVEMQKLAYRAVRGLVLDGATAWELIPFSWLADWFGNVGDYLKATRNIVPCSHSTPQIMETRRTEYRWSALTNPKPGVSDAFASQTTKTRRKSSASLSAHLPVLSLRQMSILGSLAILRSGRYH